MIGMIEPLVQEARDPRDALRAIGTYALGALSTATLAGVGWALLSLVAHRVAAQPATGLVVAGTCAALALVDLGVGGLRPFGVPRQTCDLWWRRLGPLPAWLCWGLDLGLGFTTYRATSLYWAVVLTAVFVTRPALAPLIMAGYGLGLVANLALGAIALRRTGLFSQAGSPTVLFLRPARLTSAAVLVLWGGAMAWTALS